MMDPSLLGIQLPAGNTQIFPQALPTAQAHDATRFQDLLTGVGGAGSTDALSQPTLRDQPVLQRVDAGQSIEETGSFKDTLIQQAASMDQSYHSIMEQLKSRPSFSDYSRSLNDSAAQTMRTYPAVSTPGSGDDGVASLGAMVDSMKKENAVAIQYQTDMSQWTMNFQMWSSSVELISSMVSQVSKGFQTLFRASG